MIGPSASKTTAPATLRGSIARVRYADLAHGDALADAPPPEPETGDAYERFAAALSDARKDAPENPSRAPIAHVSAYPRAAPQPRTGRPPWLDRRTRTSWRRRIANATAWTVTVAITLTTIVGMMVAVIGWDKSTMVADAARATVVHALSLTTMSESR